MSQFVQLPSGVWLNVDKVNYARGFDDRNEWVDFAAEHKAQRMFMGKTAPIPMTEVDNWESFGGAIFLGDRSKPHLLDHADWTFLSDYFQFFGNEAEEVHFMELMSHDAEEVVSTVEVSNTVETTVEIVDEAPPLTAVELDTQA